MHTSARSQRYRLPSAIKRLLSSQHEGAVRVPLWRRYLAVTLTLSIGVMLSCAAFVVMHIEGQRERQVAFNQLADERARSIEINIRHHLDILLDIQTFYAASHAVEREGHEKQTRDAGHPDFRITEPTAQGQAVPALQRPQYFPVSYLEPTAGNEALVGLDVAAYPPWLEVVHEARDTGTAIATLQSPFGRGNHTGSLVISGVHNYLIFQANKA